MLKFGSTIKPACDKLSFFWLGSQSSFHNRSEATMLETGPWFLDRLVALLQIMDVQVMSQTCNMKDERVHRALATANVRNQHNARFRCGDAPFMPPCTLTCDVHGQCRLCG